MRKIILFITTIIMASMMALSGCSCNPQIPLSFNNDFNGGTSTNLSASYKETLTYDVEYDADYNSVLKIADEIKDAPLPEFSNGTFIMEFTGDVSELPSYVKSDIDYTDNIHKLLTKFNIDITANEKTYHDSIVSEVFFFSSGNAFAPLYADVQIRNSYFHIKKENEKFTTEISQAIYNYTTEYNKDSYKITKLILDGEQDKIASFDMDNFDKSLLVEMKDPVTQDYSIKQVIDNTELLFAIRNLGLEKERSVTIPVVSPVYDDLKDPKKLIIKNNSERTLSFTDETAITYNGIAYKKEMAIKEIIFSINGTNNTGTQQTILLQKNVAKKADEKSSDTIPFRSLPVEYASSIIELSAFKKLGALVYKLKTVDFVS